MIILYSKACAFLWVANFLCLTVGSANPDTFTAFHRWGLCLTKICGFFTRRGIYHFLLIPDTYFLYHLFNCATLLDVVLFTKPTKSNTKCSVDLPTMHSHPFNTMSPCICNAVCHCMLYHVICIMNTITWTTQFTPLTVVMDNHITCI